MVTLFMIAVVCFVLGAVFLRGEESRGKLDALLNKTIFTLDYASERGNRFVGFFLIIFSIVLFVIDFSLKR